MEAIYQPIYRNGKEIGDADEPTKFICKDCGAQVKENDNYCTQCGRKLIKEGETMKEEIVTKIVGQKYHVGTIGTGDKVTLSVENDGFENHIGVYNDSDLMVGSIIHTRYDNDIVDGIANNDEIINIIDKYDWVVIKAYKHVSYLKGVLKTPNTPNYVEAMANLIKLYNQHACMHDDENCKRIARLIEQLSERMGE